MAKSTGELAELNAAHDDRLDPAHPRVIGCEIGRAERRSILMDPRQSEAQTATSAISEPNADRAAVGQIAGRVVRADEQGPTEPVPEAK